MDAKKTGRFCHCVFFPNFEHADISLHPQQGAFSKWSLVISCDFFPLASWCLSRASMGNFMLRFLAFLTWNPRSFIRVWAFVVFLDSLDLWNLFWDALGFLGFSHHMPFDSFAPFTEDHSHRNGHSEFHENSRELLCKGLKCCKTCHFLETDHFFFYI